MPDSPIIENDFLNQITAIVEKNISNEQFGVSELADEMNMSRSNLLRKIKKLTNLSVSQLIREVRLKYAMNLLRTSALNVSEVSHQVGFGSTSYFIKCFREYYGYPPGEVGKRSETETITVPTASPNKKRNVLVLAASALAVVLATGLFAYYTWPTNTARPLEKSIAVLPFKNDSNDSSNVYLINGLMESTLNNLQKIKDLKVISRTSAEKYRNTAKSIPEMAKELNVNYFVEGSGQKIGNQILLNIQLIEASSDRHLWARQYKREAKDIFQLQQEIARSIAEEIQAIITPEEEKRIEKNPTTDLVAYDLYLKGKDLLHKGGTENLEHAIPYLKQAIAQDADFALAYATLAMTYYYLDAFQTEKKYTDEMGHHADKALLLDSKLAESLLAKALFYMDKKEYEPAAPYLEKALEYNPNSILIVNFLADFYCNHSPNTSRYLEYALMGVKLDIAAQDSITASYNYLRLGNALMQTGFIDEAKAYIDKSLVYNPRNIYSNYVKAFILLAKNRDCKQTKTLLITELKKDTTRLDILQDIAKVCYFMRDYDSAYHYYKKFITLRKNRQLDIYKHEHLRIGMTLSNVGLKKESEEYIESFRQYAENEQSIYKHLNLAIYYAYRGNAPEAIAHMKRFAKEDNYQYWVLFGDIDPITDQLRTIPEYQEVMQRIETKFWNKHKEIKVTLEEKGLL